MRLFVLAAAFSLAAAQAGAVTIGVPEGLGPWGMSASLPEGQRGVYADFSAAIASHTHIPVEIKFLPYGRMVQSVKTGELDYAFGVVSPITSEAGPFIAIVAQVPMVAAARKGLPLKSMDDLHAFSQVGFLRGGSCGAAVDGDTAIHRVSQDSYDSAIRKLAAGRLDGWCSIKAGFSYALDNLKLTDQIGDQLEYGAVKIGFQVTGAKVNAPETQELLTVVEGLVKDGSVGRIFTHYLGAPYSP